MIRAAPVFMSLFVSLLAAGVIACSATRSPEAPVVNPRSCSTEKPDCPAGSQCIASPCAVAPCLTGMCYDARGRAVE